MPLPASAGTSSARGIKAPVNRSRALYRVSQGLHALRPRLDRDALEATGRILLPGERQLFDAMEKRDRRHALAVFGRLRSTGIDDRDLLAAALLHDCGKGAVPVWLRSLNVIAPRLVSVLAKIGANDRSAAFRMRNHAEIGAARADSAGSSAATVRYIRGRVPAEEQAKMMLLMVADDES